MSFILSIILFLTSIITPRVNQTHTMHTNINQCTNNTVWNEAQTWWSQPGQEHVFESSHVHLSACWPLNKTLTGVVPLDLTVKAHNLRGRVVSIQADVLPATKTYDCFTRFSCMDVPRSEITTDDVAFNYTFNMDTRNITRDGWHQIRVIVQIARDDIAARQPRENIQTTVSFMAYVKNGNPVLAYSNNTLLRASGHYWMAQDGKTVKTGYEYAKIHKLPVVSNNVLTFTYSLEEECFCDGELEKITDYAIMINPDIHNGSKGWVIAEGATTAHGQKTVQVDVSKLISGTHTLAIRAGADINARPGSKLSGITVVRFTK